MLLKLAEDTRYAVALVKHDVGDQPGAESDFECIHDQARRSAASNCSVTDDFISPCDELVSGSFHRDRPIGIGVPPGFNGTKWGHSSYLSIQRCPDIQSVFRSTAWDCKTHPSRGMTPAPPLLANESSSQQTGPLELNFVKRCDCTHVINCIGTLSASGQIRPALRDGHTESQHLATR